MLNRKAFWFSSALATASLFGAEALAHAELVSADPAHDSIVAAPQTITLTFSEELVSAFSGFEVEMAEHDMGVPVQTELSEDGKSLVGTPEAPLMEGTYTISWHVASDDGHRVEGEVSFTVE